MTAAATVCRLSCRARGLLAQLIEFRGIIPGFGNRQQQLADIGRFFNRANVGLSERDTGREIVLLDDRELVVDGACHPHAQERHSRHQVSSVRAMPKIFKTDRNTHRAAPARQETGG